MFRRDIWYAVAGLLPLALSAAVLPLQTRILDPRQFGIVSLSLAVYTVLWVVYTLGLQTGLQRLYATPSGPSIVRRVHGLALLGTASLAIVTYVLAPTWGAALGASSFMPSLRLVVIWGALAAATLNFLSNLRSLDRLRSYLAITLLQSIGAQLLGLGATLALHRTAYDYLLGVLIAQTLAVVCATLTVRPRLPNVAALMAFPALLLFSLPLILQQLGAFLLWSADRGIIQRDLGSTQQGRYGIAYAIGALAINMVSQLNQAWLPRVFASAARDGATHLLASTQAQLGRLLRPIVIALCLVLAYGLELAAPAAYLPLHLTFTAALVAVSAFPYATAASATRALLANGRSVASALCSLLAAALNVALNIVLVPRLQLLGSAIATLLSYCGLTLFLAMALTVADRHVIGTWTEQARYALAAATAVAAIAIPAPLPWLPVRAALGTACLLGIYRAARHPRLPAPQLATFATTT